MGVVDGERKGQSLRTGSFSLLLLIYRNTETPATSSAAAAQEGEQTEAAEQGGTGLGDGCEIQHQIRVPICKADAEGSAAEGVGEAGSAVECAGVDRELVRAEAADGGTSREQGPTVGIGVVEVGRIFIHIRSDRG